ncbi:MAG TPA: GNAT family N-acetyltransferase [Candidatus Dormibacteraeota bacterium]|nr:GNAT family N-acetyltransferase [Candidatus Dormibacteraeota bacterium]
MISVEDVPEQSRYELRVDGDLAGHIAYRSRGPHLALVHTEVGEAFGGRGLGSRLVAGALDQVRARGGSVLPDCPFVRTYIARHSDYLDLVPADRRSDYGLPESGAS